MTAPGVATAPLCLGVTLGQFDRLHRLVQRIRAQGDVMALGGADALFPGGLSALGEALFEAASEVDGIVQAIGLQRLLGTAAATAGTGPAGPAGVARAVYERLLQAQAMVQAMAARAGQAGGVQEVQAACQAVCALLQQVGQDMSGHGGLHPGARPDG